MFVLPFNRIPSVLSKKQLDFLKYYVERENEVITFDTLYRFDIPDQIKSMMINWDVINKSPYSDSLYSSLDVSWSYKPEGSYRVSDHWNFTTVSDGKTKKHCITDVKVSGGYVSIGVYKSGIYHILLSLPIQKYIDNSKVISKRREYLTNPIVIVERREFKNRIKSGEIFCEVIKNDIKVSGRVLKYTGCELKVVNEYNEIIFNENYLKMYKIILILRDASRSVVNDPFCLTDMIFNI